MLHKRHLYVSKNLDIFGELILKKLDIGDRILTVDRSSPRSLLSECLPTYVK